MKKKKEKLEQKSGRKINLDEDFGRIAQSSSSEVDDAGRVRLVSDGDANSPLLIYMTQHGASVELSFQESSFWATQAQMATMFGTDQSGISRHIKNIFKEGELVEDGNMQKLHTTLYSLNVIISVGYRVGSKEGTMFRMWATEKLFQILTKGFYVDTERLKNAGSSDALHEFREIAREIRTSIRNSYREVLNLCKLCADYDGTSKSARDFFMDMENKLLWASTQMTAPQLVLSRCDATKPDIGLTYYTGKRGPTKRDVEIGNNYLAAGEAKTKNRITEMWLTYVEEQLEQGRLPTMDAVRKKLDAFIKFNQWPLLSGKGKYKRSAANSHAHEQHQLFSELQKNIV